MKRLTPHLFAVAAVLLLAIPAGVAAQENEAGDTKAPELRSGTYKMDPAHASIHFIATHLGFSRFPGHFEEFDATLELDAENIENSKLNVTINPASVDAAVRGPGERNHLIGNLLGEGFFEVDKFPEASFTATKIERTGPRTGKITGDLTLHGQTHPVTLDARLIGEGSHPMNPKTYVVGFEAKGSMQRTKWGVSNLVPIIPDKIDLWINAEFHLQGE